MGTETIHETMSVAVSGNGRIQMILKDPLQLAISMNMNMESNTAGAGPDVTMQDQVSVQEWMQDGWVYIQEEMDGTTDRYKYPVGNMDGFAEFLPGDAADQRPDEQHDAAHDRLHRRLPHRIHHEDG